MPKVCFFLLLVFLRGFIECMLCLLRLLNLKLVFYITGWIHIPLIVQEIVDVAHQSFSYFSRSVDLDCFRAVIKYLIPTKAQEKEEKKYKTLKIN